jgi:chorismate mutase
MSNKHDVKDMAQLKALRAKIDQADRALLKALGGRMKTVLKIAQFKKERGIPTVQKGRWKQLMKDRMQLAERLDLNDRFTRDLFNLIHREALRLQRKRRKS